MKSRASRARRWNDKNRVSFKMFIFDEGEKVFWLYKRKRRILGLLRGETAARMRIKTLIAVVLCMEVALLSHAQSCRYWCKADEENAYYCCPSGKPETWLVKSIWPIMSSPIFWMGVIGTSLGMHAHNRPPEHINMPPIKEKLCPPLRWACPRSVDRYDPPIYCDKDDECHPMEKCCYDVCLEHRTCKPAE